MLLVEWRFASIIISAFYHDKAGMCLVHLSFKRECCWLPWVKFCMWCTVSWTYYSGNEILSLFIIGSVKWSRNIYGELWSSWIQSMTCCCLVLSVSRTGANCKVFPKKQVVYTWSLSLYAVSNSVLMRSNMADLHYYCNEPAKRRRLGRSGTFMAQWFRRWTLERATQNGASDMKWWATMSSTRHYGMVLCYMTFFCFSFIYVIWYKLCNIRDKYT